MYTFYKEFKFRNISETFEVITEITLQSKIFALTGTINTIEDPSPSIDETSIKEALIGIRTSSCARTFV